MTRSLAILAATFMIAAGGCAGKLPIPHYQCKKAVGTITVDGVLDEKSWQEAEIVTIQCERTTSGKIDPPAGYARMCWDDKNFYIAFEVPDTNITAAGRKRDGANIVEPNDVIEVFLDVNGDDYHFFEFHVNPFNTLNDSFLIRPAPGSPLQERLRFGIMFMNQFDLKEYKTAVKVHGNTNHPEIKDEKWIVEMALPFSSLMMPYPKEPPPPGEPVLPRAHPEAGEVWRVQLVVQNCDLPNRYYIWSPTYTDWFAHGIQRFGRVEFVGEAPDTGK